MNNSKSPLILVVDDDQLTLQLTKRILSGSGYDVVTASSGRDALLTLRRIRPDVILLDVMMPEMNGYDVCSRLKEGKEMAFIPVIFVTALEEEQDKAKAFAVGGADYLVKPINRDTLCRTIEKHLQTKSYWNNLKRETPSWDMAQPLNFTQFKDFLGMKLNLPLNKREELSRIRASEIYSAAKNFNLSTAEIVQYIAQFSGMNYLPAINPASIQLGKLPTPFCQKNNIVPIKDDSGRDVFVLINPFDWVLLDLLKTSFKNQAYQLAITNPNTLSSLFIDTSLDKVLDEDHQETEEELVTSAARLSEQEIAKHPIVSIANSILSSAVAERASDIHLEPKEEQTVIRFRVDGDLNEVFSIKKKTGIMLISRLKVLANMDIAEKRKPQDGAFTAVIDNKTYILRLATTSTIYGESLIIRLLNAYEKPKDLEELGMTADQSRTLTNLANRNQGLILVVGPTGSGKTTTIYSVLNKIDYKTRSIVSVEDPVEYRIPFINQEQVKEKGKVTFEALLKSVVRQDPDVLFLGEIRDNYSATTVMNFASTGHLSISTLHTTNATTAIFRLERLGINRGTMADSFIGIVAQRLLKKLCPHCREIVPISEEETKMLSSFTNEIPQEVAHPVGCPKCSNTGYYGREGVYEIINFDPELSEMVRSDVPISEMRSFAYKRRDYLISHHALEKLKSFVFPPKDVYERILVEEAGLQKLTPKIIAPAVPSGQDKRGEKRRILVVEDDIVTRTILAKLLESEGYTPTVAKDGIDALLHMEKSDYDLILSDVDMPNLDGFKVLEMKNQKEIKTPVIFLTSKIDPEDERRGFELGAMDYIKKPIQREILLLRIKKVVEK
jgi:general secretion pathway protein E